MDRVLLPPDTDSSGRENGKNHPAPEHQETAAEDESVGSYYLDQKNWRAALSRFESAVVLDPENPEVYWGLGEAQRHLGKFTEAKASYQKLIDYDPDSKHGKEARKLLKDPELANAPTAAKATP
jgi:tetratricopeptide (TPR) repeat protein